MLLYCTATTNSAVSERGHVYIPEIESAYVEKFTSGFLKKVHVSLYILNANAKFGKDQKKTSFRHQIYTNLALQIL